MAGDEVPCSSSTGGHGEGAAHADSRTAKSETLAALLNTFPHDNTAVTLAQALRTALVEACLNGNIALVNALLNSGVDPKTSGYQDGIPVLEIARANGHVDIVQALMAVDESPMVSMPVSSNAGLVLTAEILLDVIADVYRESSCYDGMTALMIASRAGCMEAVQFFLDAYADVNITSNNGHTALMLTCQNGHIEVVRALLAAGAAVNIAGSVSNRVCAS